MLTTLPTTAASAWSRSLHSTGINYESLYMKLYLARHGDYVNGGDDFARVLSERGRRDIEKIAEAVRDRGVSVQATFHSGKMRAQQTAEILADTLMSASVITMIEGIKPEDDPLAFQVAHIDTLPDESLVVGHLPFMGRMVSLLLTGDADLGPASFEAGTVVCLEREDGGEWSRAWTIHPSGL